MIHVAIPKARPCPEDFEAKFVEIGRLACEEHYHAGDNTITRWLTECGKQRLIDERAAYVREARKPKLTPREMGAILNKAFPLKPAVDYTLARHAAHFLRAVRNDGRIISPTRDGQWWFGSRRVTAAELLNIAKSKGFEVPTLRENTGFGLDCARP